MDDNGGDESLNGLDEIVVEGGSERKVRLREPFKIFGVGVGVTSWDRLRRALIDGKDDPKRVMGETLELLKRNRESAEKQNGEPARDLALLEGSDALVKFQLHAIDPDACEIALGEYTQWIKTGYSQGKLGMKPEPTTVTRLKDEVNSLLQEKEDLKREASDLHREVSDLKAKHNLIRELFMGLLAIPLVVEMIQQISKAWVIFQDLTEAIGIPLNLGPSLQPKQVTGDAEEYPKALKQGLESTKPIEPDGSIN